MDSVDTPFQLAYGEVIGGDDSGNRDVRTNDGQSLIAVLYGDGVLPQTANAHLIAAGPDMYEALLASVKTINRLNDELASRDGWGDRDWDSVDSECMAYKETLAKARGESQ